jgi:acetyltransferase EpsM
MKYLYGASGHAKVILDIINSNNEVINGVFDDDLKKKPFYNIKFFESYYENSEIENDAKFIISIGNNQLRKIVANKIKHKFFCAIHKHSILSNTCQIGLGTVVMANVVVNADAIIGNHCIINTAAIIEHDCVIEDFVHIAPNTTITGNITIGEGALIGARTVVIPGINIGKWCLIGAGSVIIEDVPDNAVVVGNPGKIIGYNEK